MDAPFSFSGHNEPLLWHSDALTGSGRPFHYDENNSGVPDEELVMEEQTRAMIEEAAYFLAQKRGFSPGYEMQDWLQAEEQITK